MKYWAIMNHLINYYNFSIQNQPFFENWFIFRPYRKSSQYYNLLISRFCSGIRYINIHYTYHKFRKERYFFGKYWNFRNDVVILSNVPDTIKLTVFHCERKYQTLRSLTLLARHRFDYWEMSFAIFEYWDRKMAARNN